MREAGLPFELVLASTKTHKLADGTDYYTINPKGYVPLLELDNGERLTEGPAIVQWIADQVPDKRLAPPAGTMPRYRLIEWLNFITAEIHKQFSPLFNPALPEDAKPLFRDKLIARFRYVDEQLADKSYLMGSDFTVADAIPVRRRCAGRSAVGLDLSRARESRAIRPADDGATGCAASAGSRATSDAEGVTATPSALQ